MKIVLMFILTCLCGISLLAQQTVASAGGNATGIGGTANYTVGQVVYTTNTGSNGSAAQGVQQPFEISVVTALKEATGITLDWSAYPNPTTDFLILKIKGDAQTQYFASLYDINGKLLLEKKIESNETTIQMGGFTPATYILKILSGSHKEIKTFKIIKH